MRRLFAFLDSPGGRFFRYAVSVALITAFIVSIDWSRFAAAQYHFSMGPAVVGLLLAGAAFPLHGWRWWLLLRAQGLDLSLHWAHWVTWISQFYNAFLLGGLGGDVARVFYVCRDEPTQKTAGLATILLDRVMGLAVLMSLAAVALATKARALSEVPGFQWLFVSVVGISLGGLAAAVFLLRTDPGRWPSLVHRMVGERGVATVTQLLEKTRGSGREHALALVGSYAIWLLDIASIWFFARAVGLHLPLMETCIASSLAYAITALPISVGGHGVREGALLGVLGLFALLPDTEAGRNAALLLALLVWSASVIWSLVGGIAVLAARRLLPARPLGV